MKFSTLDKIFLVYLLILLALALSGCKTKKEVAEKFTEKKTEHISNAEIKTEYLYKDTGSVKTIIKYQTFYDTITKKLYVYPSVIEKTENKAITESLNKSEVIISKLKESLTEVVKQKNKEVKSSGMLWSAVFWLILGLAISILINIWLIKGKVL